MGVGVSARRRDARDQQNRAEIAAERIRRGLDSPPLVLGVLGVLALGVVLRFVCQSDMWADEVLSVNIAKLPFDRLMTALRHDGAPPLYYLLLHGWMRVFGSGSTAVRALSGLAGTLTLIPMWCIGRRLDDRRRRLTLAPADSPNVVAWSALLLFALSPFAIRYSTEARMYALVMLFVALGYLAVVRALERPSLLRLATVAVVTGLLLYTHYWSFSLLAVTGLALVVVTLRRARADRAAPLSVLAALAVGALTFVPWVPSFLYQLHHTGTPWGAPVSPFGSWAAAFTSFGGNVHPAGWMLLVLVLLGVFAVAIAGDGRHVILDLGTQRGVRVEAAVAFGTVALGLLVGRLSGTTFEGRYASVAFPLFVAVGAFGLLAFGDPRVRTGVLVLALALGAWGGVSNVGRQRTQAYQLVPIIRDEAAPGDLVVFCPDAIGTDVVGRLRPDVRTTSFPNLTSSARVDWVDYADHVRRVQPARFADRVERLAGDHTIWFVYTDNGTPADAKCTKVADDLSLRRPNRTRPLEPDPYFFEHQGVYRYPATS
jgi:mannosyltransferase